MFINIFEDDAFGEVSLTNLVNVAPASPGRLGQLNWFAEEGVATTMVAIERTHGKLNLVANTPRGGTSENVNAEKRDLTPLLSSHLVQRATIMADEIQNLRAAGSESDVVAMTSYVAQRLRQLRMNVEATQEYHRVGAVAGKVMDSDGTTVITDLFTAFNLTQQTLAMDLDTDTTDVRARAITGLRLIEDTLGNAPMSGARALCSDSFFDALISHPKVEAAYDRWQAGEFLRNDPRAGFVFAGITWENFRGKVGGIPFIQADTASLVPEGVMDLFMTKYSPADVMGFANTMGIPYYAMQEILRMGKGVEVEVQSNPTTLCSRPDAIIKLGLGSTVPAALNAKQDAAATRDNASDARKKATK